MNVSAILDVITMQRHMFYASIPMNIFYNINTLIVQRRIFYTNVTMGAFAIANVTTTQLGTSCPFDSPGLARNEPTLGQRSQGDSTP